MTDIALNPAANAALAPAGPQTAFTVDLQMWAAELQAAYTIGSSLASTDFVPMTLKTKSGGAMKDLEQIAQNVAACVLAGKALGLDPMNSIQNIFIVHGRPAMYARTMVALVLAAGHEVERVTATERSVVYRARRAGAREWQTFEWTIDRAAKAGYTKNAKYASDPIAMLTAKAQAEACRVVAPDVLTGVAATSVEEVQLEDLGEAETDAKAAAPAPAAAGTTRQRRAPRTAPAPVAPQAPAGPPQDLEPVDDEEDAQAEGVDVETGELPEQQPAEQAPAPEQTEQAALCTPEQQATLQTALKAAGYTTRATIMPKVSEFAGRPIASSKQLTDVEAAELTALLMDEADAAAADQGAE